MRRNMLRLAVAALWPLATMAPAAADVEVRDPWIAETPPGAMAAAAFLVLANDGAEPRVVVHAESPVCERIEFHTTEMDGDIARMRQQESLVVPAGGDVTLEPGGTHMMLIRPAALHAGDHIPIELELADGEKLAVDAEVRMRDHHDHHEH